MRANGIEPNEVSQAGICQVLAQHLWDVGAEPETKKELSRVLKDPVSRALRGKGLSPKLLRRFAEAFSFSAEDKRQVQALYRGEGRPTVIVGTVPPLDGAVPQPYETIMLHEFHYLGRDGRPLRHRTVRTIRSLSDGFTTYRYSFDRDELTVDRISGVHQENHTGARRVFGPSISYSLVSLIGMTSIAWRSRRNSG